jgi:hypothetical protein
MVFYINFKELKMKKFIELSVLFPLMFMLFSCNDIISTDPNLQKELLLKKLSPEDSLNFLVPNELDLGSVKIGSLVSGFASIVNNSKDQTIFIYKIEQKNQSGLFVITMKDVLPIKLIPGGDVQFNESIKVKFIADSYTLGYYYDTLYLNGSRKIYVPIKAKIRY